MEHYSASFADGKILCQNSRFHSKTLEKYVRELDYEGEERVGHHKDVFWAMLANKDYPGSE